jgi:hypothetical protein
MSSSAGRAGYVFRQGERSFEVGRSKVQMRLMRLLEAAFSRRPLYRPSAFAADAGAWGGYLDAKAFKAHIKGRTWDQLSSAFLEFHHDAPMYMGPQAFSMVLPAYLAALVRGGKRLHMLPEYFIADLTRSKTKWKRAQFDARVDCLTRSQKAAVAAVLEGLASLPSYSPLRSSIEESLGSYWSKVRSKTSQEGAARRLARRAGASASVKNRR